MAKSKARFLAELLSSDGKVIKTKSQASTIVVGDLPTIPNSKLENSSVTIAGEGLSLGASLTLDTGDVTEHTNYKYYTDGRVDARITNAGSGNWNTAYGWGNHASASYITNSTASLSAAKITSGVLSTHRIPVPTNGDWWNDGFVRVQTDGVMEVGRYLDFHTADSGGATDFDLRVTASAGALAVGGTISATGGNSGNWNTAYGWGNHASASYVTSSGNTIIGTDTDLSFAGANVLASIALTDGVITAYANRTLTLANLGYTGETNATADQSAAEIRTAVEAASDSNVFTDADHSKLNAIEASATADQSAAEIRAAVEAASDSNVFTDADHTKLGGIAASANNYVLPSGIATETYVGNQITTLIGGAPELLNDLNELALAINDDENYNTTLTTALGTKLPLAGGTLTGALIAPSLQLGADSQPTLSGDGSQLKIQTTGGYVAIGPDNSSWMHFSTDRNSFYFNKKITVNGGIVDSYDEDLQLRRAASTTARLRITAGTTFSDQPLSVTGVVTATGGNSGNWNTAYGWGNHASAGYVTSYTDTNTHTHLDRTDNRTISASEFAAGDLHFGFTSWANNNSSPYADFIHMRSYTDSSGGNDNLLMFKKSGKGIRLWQSSYGSSSAYSSYVDIWDTGTLTTTNKSNYDTAYGWGNHASAGYVTTDTNTTYSVGAGGLTQQNFTTTLKNKLDGIASGANNYSLPSNVVTNTNAYNVTQRMRFTANETNNWDTIATSTGSQGSLEVFNNGSGTDAFMSFHVGADYALYFGLDGGTNKLSVGGWSMGAVSHELYHAGNKPSLATLGYTGATNANYITNNNQLTNGAGYTNNTVANAALPKAGGTLTGNLNLSGSGNHIIIGGTAGNNHFNSISSTTGLTFGGGNDFANYSIGTTTENVGGTYTKLNIKWHTGIRFFAKTNYGGVRFHSDVGMGTEILSIGNGDGHVRVANNLLVGGTVDGRDVAADGTKLDGIAAGANNFTYSLPSTVLHSNAYKMTGSGFKLGFHSGSGGTTFGANHYSMGVDIANGSWSGTNYSDLIIGYHTGIRIGAGYSGIRFYDNSPTTDTNNTGNGNGAEELLMTIGGGGSPTSGSNVTIANGLTVGAQVDANMFSVAGTTATLRNGSWGFRHQTGSGYIEFGPANVSHAHIYTDRPNFYFNKELLVNNNTVHHNGNSVMFTSADNTKLDGIAAGANATAGNPTFSDVYVSSWFRNNASGSGLYNTATGQHWYSDGDDYWNIAGGGEANGIRFRDQHAGTIRGYVYADNGNNIGFLDEAGGWALRVVSGNYTTSVGSFRSDYFYDIADTAYYLNPNGDNRLSQLRLASHLSVGGLSDAAPSNLSTSGVITFGSLSTDAVANYCIKTTLENYGGNYNKLDLAFHTGIRLGAHPNYGGVRFYTDQSMGTEIFAVGKSGNFVQAANSMRAPIFYDSNNTGYYVDPASTSNINIATVVGRLTLNGGLTVEGHTVFNGGDTWVRTGGDQGIYFATYAGGWHMTDTTWIRSYNTKQVYMSSNLAVAGNVTAYYSDERLKTKTGGIDNALEKVQSLSGFTYVENDLARELGYKNEKQQIGVSAQEVQAVVPEAVSLAAVDIETSEYSGEITSKSGENYLTVDYSRLVPLLIEAVKELTDKVEMLEKQLK